MTTVEKVKNYKEIDLKERIEIKWTEKEDEFDRLHKLSYFKVKRIPMKPKPYTVERFMKRGSYFYERMDYVLAAETLWGAINLQIRIKLAELGIYANHHATIVELGRELAYRTDCPSTTHYALTIGEELHKSFYEVKPITRKKIQDIQNGIDQYSSISEDTLKFLYAKWKNIPYFQFENVTMNDKKLGNTTCSFKEKAFLIAR